VDRAVAMAGNGPQVMATLRNLAITLLRLAGAPPTSPRPSVIMLSSRHQTPTRAAADQLKCCPDPLPALCRDEIHGRPARSAYPSPERYAPRLPGSPDRTSVTSPPPPTSLRRWILSVRLQPASRSCVSRCGRGEACTSGGHHHAGPSIHRPEKPKS
jgi:hypothetical protein